MDQINQGVRDLEHLPLDSLPDASEQIARRTRLIGEDTPDDLLASAAVADFKGPAIFGVVRIAQVDTKSTRIAAIFSGLLPGKQHAWSINEFGDLTMGVMSTGKVFNPTQVESQPLGDLGTLDVDEKGVAFYMNVKENIRVSDIIGRALVVYGSEDGSDGGIAAAVVARSAAVSEKHKFWERTNADIVISKM